MSCNSRFIVKKPAHTHVVADITDFNEGVNSILNAYGSFSGVELWNSVANTVSSLSAIWSMNASNENLSASINELYNLVLSNSAMDWNYQGTDIKSLTSNWITYNEVVTNYVNITGDVMTGGLFAPTISADNLYVGSSTIHFFNSANTTIETLNSQDVTIFKRGVNTLSALSANWQNTYNYFNEQSANNSSVYNHVNINSGGWNYQGNDIKSLTGEWQNTLNIVSTNSSIWVLSGDSQNESDPIFVSWANTNSALYVNNYNTVNINSADWNYQGTDIKSLTSVWEHTYNTVNTNSSLWILSGDFINNETDPIFSTWANTNSANYESVFRQTNELSSNWNYQGDDLKSLSANWNSVYSNVNMLSSLNESAYTTVDSNSAKWQSTYLNVNTNSAINWNYQGTDIKSLTSDWQNTFNTVNNNSAIWLLSGGDINEELDPIFTSWAMEYSSLFFNAYINVNGNSGGWDYQGTDIKSLTSNWDEVYNTVYTNSSIWLLSGGNIDEELDPIFTSWANTNSANYESVFNLTNELSSNWQEVFSQFYLLSADWQSNYSNTLSNSSNWNYQGNDIKSLTSTWEEISNVVKDNSALWILSGSSMVEENDPIFTSWANNYSAHFLNTYNTVNTNSGGWDYQGTDVQLLTAKWEDVYNTVYENSAVWLLSGGMGEESDPIFTEWLSYFEVSGAQWNNVTSFINYNSAAFLDTTTVVQDNSAVWGLSVISATNVVYLTGDQEISGIKNFTSRPTVNGVGVLLSGESYTYISEVYIDAGAMLTSVSGASASTIIPSGSGIAYDCYNFDPAVINSVQFKLKFPDYNHQGLSAKFHWTASGTGAVVFGIQGIATGDGDSLNIPWGTPQEISDTLITNTYMHITSATSVFYPNGDIQTNDMLFFRIYRNVSDGGDTLATNASLLGVSIQYTGLTLQPW